MQGRHGFGPSLPLHHDFSASKMEGREMLACIGFWCLVATPCNTAAVEVHSWRLIPGRHQVPTRRLELSMSDLLRVVLLHVMRLLSRVGGANERHARNHSGAYNLESWHAFRRRREEFQDSGDLLVSALRCLVPSHRRPQLPLPPLYA